MKDNASAGNLCSIRVTDFGDMRSFISSDAKPNSFGSEVSLVQDFNCLDAAESITEKLRTYNTPNLAETSFITNSNYR